MNSRLGKACRASRIRGWCAAAAAMSTTSCCRGMVFGYVLRSPHAHARIRSIDVSKAKAAPGVLAVLTGADWQASGFGDLPVPGGFKRRDGAPLYRPPYPALVKDRVRWVGDYVAFVVAETRQQAMDAAELIAVDYEPLPAVVATARGAAPGAPPRVGRLRRQHLLRADRGRQGGDRGGLRARRPCGQASLRHQPRHRRHHGAARLDRRLQRAPTAATRSTRRCSARMPIGQELAQHVLKVPESKVRVVAGDIGGSFGMKSAVYNEVALVLLASKLTGRPVKWISTRSESFLGDAQARDNVTEAELALDRDGIFLGMRVKIDRRASAPICRPACRPSPAISARSPASIARRAMHVDVTAVFTHTNPMRPYRGNGRPEAAYVIERMVDLAADELGIDPAELRRRNYIPPDAMPFKTGAHLHLRQRRVREEHGHGARARRRRRLRAAARRGAQARQAARHRHLQHDRARRRARLRGGGDPLRPLRRGDACSPARSPRARGTRPSTSRSSATGSASIRTRCITSRATPTRCSSAKAPAARAPPPSAARPSTWRPRRSSRKATRIAAHMLKVDADEVEFRRRHLLERQAPTAR